jgi:hypothetical protein
VEGHSSHHKTKPTWLRPQENKTFVRVWKNTFLITKPNPLGSNHKNKKTTRRPPPKARKDTVTTSSALSLPQNQLPNPPGSNYKKIRLSSEAWKDTAHHQQRTLLASKPIANPSRLKLQEHKTFI